MSELQLRAHIETKCSVYTEGMSLSKAKPLLAFNIPIKGLLRMKKDQGISFAT